MYENSFSVNLSICSPQVHAEALHAVSQVPPPAAHVPVRHGQLLLTFSLRVHLGPLPDFDGFSSLGLENEKHQIFSFVFFLQFIKYYSSMDFAKIKLVPFKTGKHLHILLPAVRF